MDRESLVATGERTAPGLPDEDYWFARHDVAYRWANEHVAGARIVVDAGAGEGYGAAMVSAIALEYDAAACEHLRTAYPRVPVVRANLAAVPVRSESVDAITCLQVIEHLWDLPRFLRDCRRVLAPGGLLIVTTPQRLTFSPGLGRGEKPLNPFHVEEFDAEQVDTVLRDAGFDTVELRGVRHGQRLSAWESAHGSVVAAQVDASLSGTWSPGLREIVRSVTVDDFVIDASPMDVGDARLDEAQDLLAAARWSR